MEDGSGGFEHIAVALLEMQQRTEALLAENRRLLAELAALRQGAGIMVAIEGRLYPLAAGMAATNDPLLLSPRAPDDSRARSRNW